MDTTPILQSIPVAPPPAPPPPPEPRPIIVPHARPTDSDGAARRWRRLLPVWILSGLIHVVLLSLFACIEIETAAQTIDSENVVIDTKIEDAPPPNLENEDIGIDADALTNFNVARIEEMSVPGPVMPAEAVGLPGGADQPATNVPPAEGFGPAGTNAGAPGPDIGKAALQGIPGGLGGGLKMMPGGFGGRSGATRERMLKEGGGNRISEAAVASGLQWLARHQEPDGHWSLDGFHKGRCNCTGASTTNNNVAGTAFGLLPMLGSGQTHKGGAGKDNPHVKRVELGLKYLLLQQNREGAFSGDMYAHGLATIAVCEAYGLTSDPQLRGPAQRALQFIVRAQNERGGWDYAARGPTPDTSIGGWQIMALKSGQMGGLDVPPATLAAATRWLNDWAGDADGSIYGYRQPRAKAPDEGGASPQSMIAIGLLCRQYLGWGPRHLGLAKGAQWLLRPENMPGTANRSHMYFHYYATQVMHHMGGSSWARWNPAMRDWLIRTQDQSRTHQNGSWDAKADWWCNPGGRIMMTSMCLLSLEVYYRHLPLYRRDMGGGK
jgi:hypothetical protein